MRVTVIATGLDGRARAPRPRRRAALRGHRPREPAAARTVADPVAVSVEPRRRRAAPARGSRARRDPRRGSSRAPAERERSAAVRPGGWISPYEDELDVPTFRAAAARRRRTNRGARPAAFLRGERRVAPRPPPDDELEAGADASASRRNASAWTTPTDADRAAPSCARSARPAQATAFATSAPRTGAGDRSAASGGRAIAGRAPPLRFGRAPLSTPTLTATRCAARVRWLRPARRLVRRERLNCAAGISGSPPTDPPVARAHGGSTGIPSMELVRRALRNQDSGCCWPTWG